VTRVRIALALALALACVAAGGRALTPDAEPGFRRVIHAIQDERRLGAGARVEGVAIDPIDARLTLVPAPGAAPVVVHLAGRDEPGASTRSRWFALRIEPPGALSPALEARLAELLDEAFPEDPFASTGVASRGAPPAGRSFDRPKTLAEAVRLELAHSPGDDEYVPFGAMRLVLLALGLGLAAGVVAVVREPR
jgi:hypothetical protein